MDGSWGAIISFRGVHNIVVDGCAESSLLPPIKAKGSISFYCRVHLGICTGKICSFLPGPVSLGIL